MEETVQLVAFRHYGSAIELRDDPQASLDFLLQEKWSNGYFDERTEKMKKLRLERKIRKFLRKCEKSTRSGVETCKVRNFEN